MAELLEAELTNRILGAFFEAYRVHGYGYPEAVYRNSLAREFALRQLVFEREKALRVEYKGILAAFIAQTS